MEGRNESVLGSKFGKEDIIDGVFNVEYA